MGLVVRVDRGSDFGLSWRLVVYQTDGNGQITHVAKPIELVLEPYAGERGGGLVPTVRLDSATGHDLMQALLAELVRLGLSPAQPLEGELKATKIHLEDMRKLAKVKP